MKNRYICIHAHFYQPPRENPWLEDIELQDSAYPFHDWNERITAECYAPNTAAPILNPFGKITNLINNYSGISFNFGPTLLSWMEKKNPDVYNEIIEADRMSMERFSGHGSAIAQVYNHTIMPLSNSRDKYTQIFWGIKDFEKRFNRFPEGIWLAETAVDLHTLDMLADIGIKFTILAPRQAARVRNIPGDLVYDSESNAVSESKIGKSIIKRGRKKVKKPKEEWRDVSEGRIDPTMPYLCKLPSGRNINLFFYDGPISQDIAFSALLDNAEAFAERLLSAFNEFRDGAQVVNIATDGETYGHHHKRGEMGLAYLLTLIESEEFKNSRGVTLTNYGEFLEKHPPIEEVLIFENSSWSCIHGVERWKENCGCCSGMKPGWTQTWRRPLRESLDWLRDGLASLYEFEAQKYLKDPWKARDDYIDVLFERSWENMEHFFERHASKFLSEEENTLVLKLLEMQRYAMFMYTSCGWFFDEVSGIETVQIMQYAARAMQLNNEVTGINFEPEFTGKLRNTPSNYLENGAKAYEMFVKPAQLNFCRFTAHYAITSIFEHYPGEFKIACYYVKNLIHNMREKEGARLAVGKVTVISDQTLEKRTQIYAVLHSGDNNINVGVADFWSDDQFYNIEKELFHFFETANIDELNWHMHNCFGDRIFTLWHLFKDEQRNVVNRILKSAYDKIDSSYRHIYENTYPVMNFLEGLHMPLTKAMYVAAEYILNQDIRRVFESDELSIERLEFLISEVNKWSVGVEKEALSFSVNAWLKGFMEKIYNDRYNVAFYEKLVKMMDILRSISIEPDLGKARKIYFSIVRAMHEKMRELARQGDGSAVRWLDVIDKLGDYLNVEPFG